MLKKLALLQEKKELKKTKRVLDMGAMSPISKTPRKKKKHVSSCTPTHLSTPTLQVFGSPKMALLGESGQEIQLSELGRYSPDV